jgi:hypothetical protein
LTLLTGKTIGQRLLCCGTAMVLAHAAISGSARAADPGQDTADRIAVLDAGTFLRVEARKATLGEVIERLKAHLNIEVTGSQLVDLSHVVDGSKAGTPSEVIRWLAPDASFILIFGEPKRGEPKPGKLERIGFVSSGTATPTDIASAAMGKPVDPAQVKPELGAAPVPRAVPAVTGRGSRPSATDQAAGKPDIPSAPKTEIKTIAEQLVAHTPQAQQAIEAAAHDPSGQSPPPEFLAPQSNAAILSVEQQMERTQALAVEQLRGLMKAFRAVGASPGQGASAAQR